MVGLTAWLLLQIGKKDTNWRIEIGMSERRRLILLCILTEVAVIFYGQNSFVFSKGYVICFGAFWGCLLAACVMDQKEQKVYRFVWLAAGIAVSGCVASVLCMAGEYPILPGIFKTSCLELLLFVLLQQGLFSRMYGKADCYCFSVCGAVWLVKGAVFDRCVIHMAVSFGLLTIVQLLRRNVTYGGRLKQSVPMVPYITIGFGICIIEEVLERAVLGNLG